MEKLFLDEKIYFDQQTVGKAPIRWSEYTSYLASFP